MYVPCYRVPHFAVKPIGLIAIDNYSLSVTYPHNFKVNFKFRVSMVDNCRWTCVMSTD